MPINFYLTTWLLVTLAPRSSNETDQFTEISTGSQSGATFAPRDVFWGQIGGCLEALDSGTTTVVDHSNINNSPAHSELYNPLISE